MTNIGEILISDMEKIPGLVNCSDLFFETWYFHKVFWFLCQKFKNFHIQPWKLLWIRNILHSCDLLMWHARDGQSFNVTYFCFSLTIFCGLKLKDWRRTVCNQTFVTFRTTQDKMKKCSVMTDYTSRSWFGPGFLRGLKLVVLPQSSRRPTFFLRINEISLRIMSWNLWIISWYNIILSGSKYKVY